MLRPGGVVLLSTPNLLWWKYRVDLLRGRYPTWLEYRLRYGEDFGHVRTITPKLLRELVEGAGLGVARVRGQAARADLDALRHPPDPSHARSTAWRRAFPNISDDMLLVARKPG